MRCIRRIPALALSSAFALVVSSGADSTTQDISVVFSTNFDGANPLSGWTIVNSSPPVVWAADATPSNVGSSPSHVSPPNSLNYNNGTTYDGGTNSGSATSPPISVAGGLNVTLQFQCAYQTETPGASIFDQRRVQISNDNFASMLLNAQLATLGGDPAAGGCAGFGVWHNHTIALPGAWGTIQVRFFFNTGDGALNSYAGWFIDNMEIRGNFGPLPPFPPTQLVQSATRGGPPEPPGYIHDISPALYVRGRVADPNTTTDQVRLQVEVKPRGVPFSGEVHAEGNLVPASGGISEAELSNVAGQQRWRARARDTSGMTSAWVEFAPSDEVHFNMAYKLPREGNNGNNSINDKCQGALPTQSGVRFAASFLSLAGLILLSMRRTPRDRH